MGPSPHRGGHGGGSVAGKAEVRPGRVLVGGIVPGAASGGRKTGIAWAFRGLSLAFHGGAIAAAVAVAGPQPAAVIEAYTVEIVYSDRLAGGHGEGTDMPPAPSPAGSAKAAGLADPSTADRAMAGLRAADPAAPGISLSDAVPVPDPAPPAEVAGPPEGAPSPGAAGASPAYRSRGDTPLVPPATICGGRPRGPRCACAGPVQPGGGRWRETGGERRQLHGRPSGQRAAGLSLPRPQEGDRRARGPACPGAAGRHGPVGGVVVEQRARHPGQGRPEGRAGVALRSRQARRRSRGRRHRRADILPARRLIPKERAQLRFP